MAVVYPGAPIIRLARQAVAATPPDRDRVVDLLRAGSLFIVVIGHILMAYVTWDDGEPVLGNLLAELPSLQILTWVLQIMPLFFAAGAIANRGSWLRATDQTWMQWCWGRVIRLFRPVVYYLAVWIPLVLILQAVVGESADPLARLSTQLLWFLGVYVLVVAATPLQVNAAQNLVPWIGGLIAAAVLVDLARFHVSDAIGLLNFVVVWQLAAVVGLVVRDLVGTPRQRSLWLWAGGAVGINILLVWLGPYPLTMVGMPGEEISNMAPPSTVLMLHALAQLCVVGAVWQLLERFCARPRVWFGTVTLGGIAMTMYLWHLSALAVVIMVSHWLGLDRPEVSSPWFWPATAVYALISLAVIWLLVSVAVPLEHLKLPWGERPQQGVSPAGAPWWCGVGCSLIGISMLALSATGLEGFPFETVVEWSGIPLSAGLGVLVFVVGLLMVRHAARTPATADRAAGST